MYVQQHKSKPCPNCYGSGRMGIPECGVCLGSGRVFEAMDRKQSKAASFLQAAVILFLFFGVLWIASLIVKAMA